MMMTSKQFKDSLKRAMSKSIQEEEDTTPSEKLRDEIISELYKIDLNSKNKDSQIDAIIEKLEKLKVIDDVTKYNL